MARKGELSPEQLAFRDRFAEGLTAIESATGMTPARASQQRLQLLPMTGRQLR